MKCTVKFEGSKTRPAVIDSCSAYVVTRNGGEELVLTTSTEVLWLSGPSWSTKDYLFDYSVRPLAPGEKFHITIEG
jgi:hypothetical protein